MATDTIRLHEPSSIDEMTDGLTAGFDYTYHASTIADAIDRHVAATFGQHAHDTYVLRNPSGDRLHFIIETLGGQFPIDVVQVLSCHL